MNIQAPLSCLVTFVSACTCSSFHAFVLHVHYQISLTLHVKAIPPTYLPTCKSP
ncbi:hypothetical protein TGAM01_v200604 [Trichoderma gamsii]|uniref:Uncharacterized protein n=1 Tax=Trichoderma gamsii TaxID=398673 RepID=A0A2P5A0U2_9HYPO|nr:hypothetical protein TGAM01_v200604 [Trichoderma gamsii]PON30164.1 hypothetical protein TGAM01_v200604 [Trichoderma gamsii]